MRVAALSSQSRHAGKRGTDLPSETWVCYYGTRYYSPSLGRFINRDSIEEQGGLNLYAFVGNNAVNAYDVLGRDAFAGPVGTEWGGTPRWAEIDGMDGDDYANQAVASANAAGNSMGMQQDMAAASANIAQIMGDKLLSASLSDRKEAVSWFGSGTDFTATFEKGGIKLNVTDHDYGDKLYSYTASASQLSAAIIALANKQGGGLDSEMLAKAFANAPLFAATDFTGLAASNAGGGQSNSSALPTGAVQNGKAVTYYFEDDHYEVWSGGSRAWRNNNPGNLRNGSIAVANGSIGQAGGFAVFPDYQSGRNALGALLGSSLYRNETVGSFLNTYAPSSENDTGAYRNFLVQQTGLNGGLRLDGLNNTQLSRVMDAIQTYEGYQPGTVRSYPLPVYQRGPGP